MKINKKYAYSFAVLFAVAMVSAGLVSYLSNEVTVDVTVMSPVLLEVSTDGSNWIGNEGELATLPLGNVYAGESITFWIQDTNLADVPIVGYSTKLVTNEDGVTCDDFVSITADGNDISSFCVQGLNKYGNPDSNTVDFSAYTSGGLDAGEVNENEITIAFKQNAIGTYVFTMRKMADTE